MPTPHRGSSGMRNGRKRPGTELSILPESEALAASATTSTVPNRGTYYHRAPNAHSSTPASALFQNFSEDGQTTSRPTPDAHAHFAYSTTLRRRPETKISTPEGVFGAVKEQAVLAWERVIGFVMGRGSQEDTKAEDEESSPKLPKHDRRDTQSARFAHTSIDVRVRFSVLEVMY
jgi:Ca2+-transporting ATPase